jgi:hypothetical protein
MEVSNASRKPFQRRLLSYFLTILVAYLVVLLLVRMFESRLIFFPNYPDRLEGDWHPRALNVEDVWLTASDGVRLHAWWIPDDQSRSSTAVRTPLSRFNSARRCMPLHFLPKASFR